MLVHEGMKRTAYVFSK